MKLRLIIITLAFIFFVALALNGFWEAFHVALYDPGTYYLYHITFSDVFSLSIPYGYLSLWLKASVADALYLVGFYLLVAFINRSFFWVAHWDIKDTIIVTLFGFLTATAIEYHALSLNHWRYGDFMPLVPFMGVGVTPFLQLAVTALVAFWVTRRTFGFERRIF